MLFFATGGKFSIVSDIFCCGGVDDDDVDDVDDDDVDDDNNGDDAGEHSRH